MRFLTYMLLSLLIRCYGAPEFTHEPVYTVPDYFVPFVEPFKVDAQQLGRILPANALYATCPYLIADSPAINAPAEATILTS